MIIARAHLKSMSPYSQSRHHDTEKLEKEQPDAYERRTWRNKLHVDANGNVNIPPMAFKNCLNEAAKYLSVKIAGKGQATYTKHFEAGVGVMQPLVLPLKKDEVPGEDLFLNADGKPGTGTRVTRWFPRIDSWQGVVEFYIFDETITEDVFKYHLEQAGLFIGIGRFRPRNRGFYGRFTVEKVDWRKQ